MRILLSSKCGIEAHIFEELPQADVLLAKDTDSRFEKDVVMLCRMFRVNQDYSLQAVWGQSRKKVEALPKCDWFLTDDGRVYAKLLQRRYQTDENSKGPRWLHRAENLWPEMRSKLQPMLRYVQKLAPVFKEGFEKYFLTK